MKTLITAMVLAATVAGLGAASARPFKTSPQAVYAQSHQASAAEQIDDGSGYWGKGTATGGPSGGLPNRN